MDEAERCHGLAILDRGVIVADGSPAELEERIDAWVVEVEAPDASAARHALEGQTGVFSVTQLGARLRVLLEKERAEPEKQVQDAMKQAGVKGGAYLSPPNLEDVFVAATQGRYQEGRI
jgi:ABC-2 type transport system ATP-binding protein